MSAKTNATFFIINPMPFEPRVDDGGNRNRAQLRVARRCLRMRAYARWCGFSGVVLMWR